MTQLETRSSPATRQDSGGGHRRGGEWLFHAIGLLPGLLLIVAVVVFSLYFLVDLSLRDTTTYDMFGGEHVGLATIEDTLTSDATLTALKNSVIWIGGSVALIMLLGVPLGNLLSRETLPVRITRAFMLVPWVLPGIVVAAVWRWGLSSDTGFINDALVRVGLLDQGHPWLGDPETALWAVMAVMVWRLFTLVGLVIGAAIQTIDTAVEEAAAVDGASRWQLFFRIRIPMVSQHILTMALLTAIWVANNLVFVHAMTGGGPVDSTLILPVHIMELGFTDFDLSAAAVVSLVNVVLLLVFASLYFRASGLLRSGKGQN
ncbi:carbohydrate ABC transporter permease [Jiangella asiatica]|uniref:Sugar ABC transporter permease n=1 Tax=Jiangella asiatica TaxID=2530372 RepID=A0A4R5DJA2_9ACTN|nr:sugar ABC transporter permease [Jiangella asiatica]TDE14186.1 sugar ABC transporter permease [Jiangella asiatica]